MTPKLRRLKTDNDGNKHRVNNNGFPYEKAVLKSTRQRRVYPEDEFSDIQIEMLKEIVEKQRMCHSGQVKVPEYEEIDNPGWHNGIRAMEDPRNDKDYNK
ncbi:hypothetical protein J7J90_02720 [Candidatus Micrarchaeota archaeon]|nr:hypothetical protein [Candidatus Micrarchaeota archaeon]